MRAHCPVVLLILVLFFFAPFSTQAETMVLRNHSKSVSVTVGQKFSLEIESNATTGYEWSLAHPIDENILRFTGKGYLMTQNATERPISGAGGNEIWTFEAVGKGTTEISLKYVRPWEKEHPSDRKMIFQVVVN